MTSTIYDTARLYIRKYREAKAETFSGMPDEEAMLEELRLECEDALAWVDRLEAERERWELEVARGR